MASDSEKKNIVVIGGGIIGCTTAYFLSRHPAYDPAKHSITLLEATNIAGGASGKAGGLLALWAYPSNIVPLSFRLHAELAKEHNGAERWGYRRVHCAQIDAKRRPASKQQATNGSANKNDSVSLQKRSEAAMRALRDAGVPKDLDWLSPDAVLGYSDMGTPDDTAQVHPYQFTTSMASLASEAGVKIITNARATSINPSSSTSNPTIESISYTTAVDDGSAPQTTSLPATTAILAAGPWTANLLPSAPISGLRAHSVTIRPTRPVSAYALFTHISGGSGASAPEIYARPNNEVYACGEGDRHVPLPDDTSSVAVDASRCADIVSAVGAVSDELRGGEVTANQACYLPVCDGSGGPYIGPCKEMRGLLLAAGHTCWGIQNAPATGKLIAEVVFDGKAASAKLGRLEPTKSMYSSGLF